jgi:hypothetical protein
MAQTDETLDMDEEMNGMLLEEQVDPVSGNTAPVGAMPSEVRDDIEINVSPNEFVIPSYAVRYFGEGFFDELLGAAEQGWERIKKGEEPMPPESDSSPEELKEGYAEGGGTPSEESAVPEAVGGGYGQYGGTGSRFSGFSYKTFINAETGQEIRVYFFNDKPLSRIPEGYREKGVTAVEEQAQITAEATDNGDTVSTAAQGGEDTWRNTPVSDWDSKDYNDYNLSMRDSIKNNKDPLGLGLVEEGILGIVGSLIGGPLGGVALTGLAKKAKARQAQEAHTAAINLMETSTDPLVKTSADITRYITGSALRLPTYAVNVANPFSGYAEDDNIFQNVIGALGFDGGGGDLDEYGMPTKEAVDARNIAQYGEDYKDGLSWQDDLNIVGNIRPPSRPVGKFLGDGIVDAGAITSSVQQEEDDSTTSIEDLRQEGTSTIKVNTGTEAIIVSNNNNDDNNDDSSNWEKVVNPGTNAITRRWKR